MTTVAGVPQTIDPFLPVEGTRLIETDWYLAAEAKITDAIDDFGIALLSGPAGLGKTFSARNICRRATAAGQLEGYRLAEAVFTARPTTRAIAEKLLKALTGVTHTGRRDDVSEHLIDVLRQPTVLLVDEAQFFNNECMQYLRYLYELDDSRLALILVGGPGCWRTVSKDPMLAGRIYRHAQFQRLPLADVLAIMPDYHPLLATATERQLTHIDNKCGKGVFRSWKIFLKSAVKECQRVDRDRLDDEIIKRVIARIGRPERD